MKVIYHGFGAQHASVIISFLYSKYKWKPVCMAGVGLDENNHLDDIPLDDCIISYPRQIRRAQFDYGKIGAPVHIDEEILIKLSKYEPVFLNLLGSFQDPTGAKFGYNERRDYYIEVLTYWNTVILAKKPDSVVFYTWPHTPSCYPLYVLSKYIYNISILFIDSSPLLNDNYHVIDVSLEDLSYPLRYDSENLNSEKIDLPTGQGLDYSSHPNHILSDFKKYEKSGTNLDRFIKFTKGKIKLSNALKIKNYIKGVGIDWKANNEHYSLSKSRMSRAQFFLFFEKIKRKNRRLKKVYKNKVAPPDFDINYIYFSAPYQPEANSFIGGGYYENVLFTLRILSSVIPKKWMIYYKEHPAIFFDNMRGSLKRSDWFFDRVIKLENIKMIDFDYDQLKLIDNSKAVAVITGSAAWEAVVKGKPVISFGQGWYSGCKGIVKVTSLQDVKDVVELIINDYKPSSKDVDQYIATIKRVAFKFPEHYSQVAFDEKRAELVADEFYKAYERYYESDQ
jgi:hypothetical protein